MSARWTRPLVAAVDAVNRRGKAAGVRLVKSTGKSPHFIHPKHLVDAPWHNWYLSRWKREAALARPGESTGFRVVARARA